MLHRMSAVRHFALHGSTRARVVLYPRAAAAALALMPQTPRVLRASAAAARRAAIRGVTPDALCGTAGALHEARPRRSVSCEDRRERSAQRAGLPEM